MNTQTPGWLAISTEGFAAMNAARPPEHLIKEIVRNSLDSFDIGQQGIIKLNYGMQDNHFFVQCLDNGSGINSLSDLRVVYLTNKTDSHLKRSRFGRGFKEALCIADQAMVSSGGEQLEFLQEDGVRISRSSFIDNPIYGTHVRMQMPWSTDICEKLDQYFNKFLTPDEISLLVNGLTIKKREVLHQVKASLSTEIYDPSGQCWKKPSRKTLINLIQIDDGENPMINEMGIPVASLEWSMPLHCDIQQRVPMNPNRDAVASGYPIKVHIACLPTLLAGMDENSIKEDWVGIAGRRCSKEVQHQIIERAFGSNIARSVPKVGARHFDENARELGIQVINTAEASGGFREMLKAFVPSAKEVVTKNEQFKADQVNLASFTIANAISEKQNNLFMIEQQGGVEHVQQCLDFSVWFCQQLLNSCKNAGNKVTGELTYNSDDSNSLYAFWSADNVLALAIDQDCFWKQPHGEESLMVLIHEAAHALNQHHGFEFREEVQRLAGVAASLMLHKANNIRMLFPRLFIDVHTYC